MGRILHIGDVGRFKLIGITQTGRMQELPPGDTTLAAIALADPSIATLSNSGVIVSPDFTGALTGAKIGPTDMKPLVATVFGKKISASTNGIDQELLEVLPGPALQLDPIVALRILWLAS